MQAQIDCFYCYFKQIVNVLDIAGIEEERQYQLLFDLVDDVKQMDRTRTPAENTTEMLLKLYRLIDDPDPFKASKEESNAVALEYYPFLTDYLQKSTDKLYDALKIAAAGNIIDLGIKKDYDLEASLQYSLKEGFAIDHYPKFAERLAVSDGVLIIGDNAGEIVFDRLLVEELTRRGKKVTYLVKDIPILNDATMDDARQVGMDQIATVITTGSPYLGLPLAKIPAEARALLAEANLIIAKGQANFETLEHEELAKDKVFFLLKIKCDCVGQVANAKLDDVVFFTR